MTGVLLILVLAVMGGIIAFIADKVGSKIGKKRLRLFGLRPKYTSVIMTVISGIVIAVVTMSVLTVSSQEVRTALFGMKQLRADIADLTKIKDDALKEVANQKTQINALDGQIKKATTDLNAANAQKEAAQSQKDQAEKELASMQGRYNAAQARLTAAQAQIAAVEAARDNLKGEVTELEAATKKLREGMVAIREGNMVFRSGEVLFAGDMKSGLNETDNKAQMNTFLAAANSAVVGKIGAADGTQLLWIDKEIVSNALKTLSAGHGNYYVRVVSAGNIISGELVVCNLELVTNKEVFDDGKVILRQKITVDPGSQEVDMALLAFLKDVNVAAQQAGVVPDPITGKVGAIRSGELAEISTRIRKAGGRVELVARAKGDITVAGPVLIHVEVHKNEQ